MQLVCALRCWLALEGIKLGVQCSSSTPSEYSLSDCKRHAFLYCILRSTEGCQKTINLNGALALLPQPTGWTAQLLRTAASISRPGRIVLSILSPAPLRPSPRLSIIYLVYFPWLSHSIYFTSDISVLVFFWKNCSLSLFPRRTISDFAVQ